MNVDEKHESRQCIGSHLFSCIFSFPLESSSPPRSNHSVNHLYFNNCFFCRNVAPKHLTFSYLKLTENVCGMKPEIVYFSITVIIFNIIMMTSAKLVLAAPLPPFPYRPREIFRPSTKYVRIKPFPFT